jgi:hypothetical protein
MAINVTVSTWRQHVYFMCELHCWHSMWYPEILFADFLNTVKLGYSNIGFCDTLSIASNIQWYAQIPHKATVFDIRL